MKLKIGDRVNLKKEHPEIYDNHLENIKAISNLLDIVSYKLKENKENFIKVVLNLYPELKFYSFFLCRKTGNIVITDSEEKE